mmetsp:Transcript_35825/g.110923  ORF Transcript_35825/g.110923 Transcript_35825/m.110923 type:complete len:316 (-) Transcript_35825:809-1756(-)
MNRLTSDLVASCLAWLTDPKDAYDKCGGMALIMRARAAGRVVADAVVPLLRLEVAHGSLLAHNQLGIAYEQGHFGLARSKADAFKYFRDGAVLGSIGCHVQLSRLADDTDEAITHMGAAASLGCGDSCFALATVFFSGQNPWGSSPIPMDLTRGTFYLNKGIELGHDSCKVKLGELMKKGLLPGEGGLGVSGFVRGEPDLVGAVTIFRDAAGRGNSDAMYEMACVCDDAYAIVQLVEATGMDLDMTRLSRLGLRGTDLDAAYSECQEWLELAASKGMWAAKAILTDPSEGANWHTHGRRKAEIEAKASLDAQASA